jgi:hypothetical protein
VFHRITVDGFVAAAVNRQIGLAVTREVQFVYCDPAGDRLFEDSGKDAAITKFDFSGLSNVGRDHARF